MTKWCRVEGILIGDQSLLLELEKTFREVLSDSMNLEGSEQPQADNKDLWSICCELPSDTDLEEIYEGRWDLSFTIDWKAPIEVFNKLHELGLSVFIEFGTKEGFVGVYDNGKVITTEDSNLSAKEEDKLKEAKGTLVSYFEEYIEDSGQDEV